MAEVATAMVEASGERRKEETWGTARASSAVTGDWAEARVTLRSRRRQGFMEWTSISGGLARQGKAWSGYVTTDEQLLRDTLRATGIKTASEAVEDGLRTLLRLSAQAEIRQLG